VDAVGDNPGAGNLTAIAARMVARYSGSLADYVDGVGMIGDGSVTLRNRLIRYVENKRRKKKNPLRRKLLGDGGDATDDNTAENSEEVAASQVNCKRKATSASSLTTDSYGCSN
jgi:hypothetical protein